MHQTIELEVCETKADITEGRNGKIQNYTWRL
jgi:hypothetical protein